MPRYDLWDGRELVIASEALKRPQVLPKQEREFDAVIMNVSLKVDGYWKRAAAHIGVVAAPGQVLHIHQGFASQIDALADMDVARIVRMA